MRRLLGAELLKLRTTKLVYGMLAAAVGLAALGTVGTLLTAGQSGSPPLDTHEGIRNVFGTAGGSTLFALILGILVVTGELRHGTITQTFLVTPDRTRVVAAKVAAIAVVGLVVGIAACLATLAIGVPWVTAKHVGHSLLSADVVGPLAAVLVSSVLFGIIGVGVGALIRNQVAAIIVSLAWIFVVEGILVAVLPSVGRWLPQGAARGLAAETLSKGDLLPPWGAGLLLLAYGLVFAAVGSRLLVRRDIT